MPSMALVPTPPRDNPERPPHYLNLLPVLCSIAFLKMGGKADIIDDVVDLRKDMWLNEVFWDNVQEYAKGLRKHKPVYKVDTLKQLFDDVEGFVHQKYMNRCHNHRGQTATAVIKANGMGHLTRAERPDNVWQFRRRREYDIKNGKGRIIDELSYHLHMVVVASGIWIDSYELITGEVENSLTGMGSFLWGDSQRASIELSVFQTVAAGGSTDTKAREQSNSLNQRSDLKVFQVLEPGDSLTILHKRCSLPPTTIGHYEHKTGNPVFVKSVLVASGLPGKLKASLREEPAEGYERTESGESDVGPMTPQSSLYGGLSPTSTGSFGELTLASSVSGTTQATPTGSGCCTPTGRAAPVDGTSADERSMTADQLKQKQLALIRTLEEAVRQLSTESQGLSGTGEKFQSSSGVRSEGSTSNK